MIPILYDPLETQFTSNGIGLLTDTISCIVEEERNGGFELTLQYPQEGHLAEYIVEDAIIKAKPNDKDEEQLFRIYKSGKQVGGVNTYYAEHISYELNMNPVCRPSIAGKTAQEAIAQLLEDAAIQNGYTAWSDITTRNSTQIDDVLSVRNALGGIEGSILDVWGGEYQFDNYTIKLHKTRGKDTGATIRYGKNLITAEQEKNIEDVITAVFPYCYYTPEREENQEEIESVFVSLPEKIIKTQNADKYARIKCTPVDFSSEFENDTVVTEEMLRKVAKEYTESGIDEPKISIKATFQNLTKTKDYENMQAVEMIGICDIVTVMIEKLGIEVKAKVVKYAYDSIKERFNSVEIGEPKTNLTKSITIAQKEQKKQIIKTATRAEIIQKRIEQTIKDVTNAITGNSGGHVLIYPAENPQEIFIMDTPDTSTAKNVWRWNLEGLGHSKSGIGGPFETAITAAGQIVADFVTAGKLNGAIIEAGTINAESLSVEYKQSVKKSIEDGDEKVLSEMESRFEVTGEAITAEVKRAQKAEKTISDDLKITQQDAEEFKENVEGAFRDGIITETEAQTIERYLKELEKDNASIQKQYNAVLDSASRQTVSSATNLSIKFNADCKSEVSSTGTKYDYLCLYYKKDEKIYKALDKQSGEDIAGKTYVIPSTDIYIQWYSDGSNSNFYGFSIDELKQTTADADITGVEAALPSYEVIETATASMMQTSHPYENSMRKLWHYKSRTVTRATLISKKTAYTNAYNNLINAINTAISDKKITEAEKTNVNTKFDLYNKALAELEETIEAVGVDIAAIAAAAVAEYARAAIKVEADKIELRVTSKQVESLIEQKADSIRLKASKISWQSTYSSMSEAGVLKCTSAELKGTMKCGSDSGYWMQLAGTGKLTGGYGNTQYGYIDYSATVKDIDTGKTYNGLQVQGGCMRISVNQLSTRKTNNVSTLAYIGATGKFKYISSITARSDGGINWTETTVNFENGLLVSSL
ncbi:phage tail spike protein [Blautia stercoris]|uniref:phage tail spike protein n=1 Tax=Blautia stercoris TaxID=871664 RepID=UPI00355C06FC